MTVHKFASYEKYFNIEYVSFFSDSISIFGSVSASISFFSLLIYDIFPIFPAYFSLF